MYKDIEYFVISTLGEMVELAPTVHGAGSFMVHGDFVVQVQSSKPNTPTLDSGFHWC